MPPKAATSSKPSGAAAMCCASRTTWMSASRPDRLQFSAVSLEGSLLPNWTPPQMAGFLFVDSRHRRRGERGDNVHALWHSQARTGVPAGTRVVALAADAVVALPDKAEGARIGIERGIEEADRLAARSVHHRN